MSDQLDRERSISAILADPDAKSIPLEGANGRVVVTDTGEAALVVSGLATAPEGKTYELWVAEDGKMLPAGVFDAQHERDVVRLTRPVPPGSGVAVTVEDDGGTDAPTAIRSSPPASEPPARDARTIPAQIPGPRGG